MSFGIKQTFKNRVNFDDDDEVDDLEFNMDSTNYENASKLIETVKKHSLKSGYEGLTASELSSVIRSSSINPDINPLNKDDIDEMFKSKSKSDDVQRNRLSTTSAVGNGLAGFSAASTSTFNVNTFRALMDEELKKELEQIQEQANGKNVQEDDEENAVDEKSQEESEEEYRKRLEDINAKKMMRNGFPSRASILRGQSSRQAMGGNGIKRTAQGMVDAF